MPLIRLWAVNGTTVAPEWSAPPRRPWRSLASTTIERPSGVSSASEASCAAVASAATSTLGAGMNSAAWRLPKVMVPVLSSSSTSMSPAASTARPDRAMTLARCSRSMPAMPIAESRPPMVVGMRQTSSATRAVMVTTCPAPAVAHREDRERQQGGAGEQEDDGHRRQEDGQGDLVRRLLPLGALDQGDHPLDEAVAGGGGDLDHQPVGKHPGAAGDRAAVAAGFADHRRALAGDRALVHRGDADRHLAVGGDGLASGDQHQITGLQLGGVDGGRGCIRGGVGEALRLQRPAGAAQGVGVGPAAAFGQGLAQIGEPHREPQPGRDGADEPRRVAVVASGAGKPKAAGEGGADPGGEHHRVAQLAQRIQPQHAVAQGAHQDGFGKQRGGLGHGSFPQVEVFDHRPEHHRGQEGQGAEQQHHGDQQADEQRPVGWQGAAAGGTIGLRARPPAMASTGTSTA